MMILIVIVIVMTVIADIAVMTDRNITGGWLSCSMMFFEMSLKTKAIRIDLLTLFTGKWTLFWEILTMVLLMANETISFGELLGTLLASVHSICIKNFCSLSERCRNIQYIRISIGFGGCVKDAMFSPTYMLCQSYYVHNYSIYKLSSLC